MTHRPCKRHARTPTPHHVHGALLSYKKKLIEVALPLDAINREAAREKSIRHGHPSTLHLWWARRPLAACRAVLFAQLVDDPSAHPDQFPTEEAQEAERLRLFGIIEELVKWENVTNETVLQAARKEIFRSCDGNPPPIVDPFAGGGSIPLEAQRLGLEAHASDLNPVAVLINKALIEIPPRWANRPPVQPGDSGTLGNRTWERAQGLAEDLRHYGDWILTEAEQRIGHLYPRARLEDGTTATALAWLWARTVTCPNPACGASMPLVRSFWLGKKKGHKAWVSPVVDEKVVRFRIGHGADGPPIEGTVNRQGATCLVCESPVTFDYIRSEGRAGRIGLKQMAIVAEGHRRRIYLDPSVEHEEAAELDTPSSTPRSPLPAQALGFRVQAYGMTDHAQLFTSRQLTTLCTLSDLVVEAHERCRKAAEAAGWNRSDAVDYATDLATYLALAIDRVAMSGNNLVRWNNSGEKAQHIFGRQAVSMIWDFAETNPFASATGSFMTAVEMAADALATLPARPPSVVEQASALGRRFDGRVVCTDPPYYDNVGYADLSDFFYVWLRRSLRTFYGELLGTMLTPKSDELVADPARFEGGRLEAREFFEKGFVETFSRISAGHHVEFPCTVFYAFRQAEDDESGTASTGWETLLEGMLKAGLAITGTWPMRTEMPTRMRSLQSNALASSIVLVCRPRLETAGVTDRAGFISALRSELPDELGLLQQAAIAPVDLAQASIGPGMAVFSRYAKVVEPSGVPMRVRTALGLINQVLAEVLDAADGELDADTRWAVKWFEQRGLDEGPYGEAEVLATATGVSVDGLVRSGIVSSRAGRVRLLERSELPEEWDPVSDDRISVWEATQHLVKALEEGGESAAAELLGQLGGIGDSAQQLAYRLYSTCERKGWAKEAGPYNALAAVWGSLRTFASVEVVAEQGTLL